MQIILFEAAMSSTACSWDIVIDDRSLRSTDNMAVRGVFNDLCQREHGLGVLHKESHPNCISVWIFAVAIIELPNWPTI